VEEEEQVECGPHSAQKEKNGRKQNLWKLCLQCSQDEIPASALPASAILWEVTSWEEKVYSQLLLQKQIASSSEE
jgi:hypothetical protein